VLRGEINAEQAERIASGKAPPVQSVTTPVSAQVEAPRCPQCGGAMIQTQGRTLCRHCGYTPNERPPTSNAQALTVALLKRRSQPVVWRVERHVLRCEQCGAAHVQARTLAAECPFCGSAQVGELGPRVEPYNPPIIPL